MISSSRTILRPAGVELSILAVTSIIDSALNEDTNIQIIHLKLKFQCPDNYEL